MPFSDPEARRLYQRELMRKRRAESKGKKGSNGTNAGTNRGSNTVSPVRPSGLPKRAEQCPNGCGYKTRDHEKLQRHLKNYCPGRNAGSGTNIRDMDHKSDVSPSSSPSPGNLIRAKGEYTGGELRGKCPICGTINVMDPARSFRPLSSSSKCDHFQQLEAPGKPSDFLFKKMAGLTGLTGRTNNARTNDTGTNIVSPQGIRPAPGAVEGTNIRPVRTNGSNTSPHGPREISSLSRIWIKLDHSVDKGQIILKESSDGDRWKTARILTKGQAFEIGNVVIVGTWHRGSVKEAESVSK